MYKKRSWLRPHAFLAEYLDFPLEFRENVSEANLIGIGKMRVKNEAVTSYVFCTQFYIPIGFT